MHSPLQYLKTAVEVCTLGHLTRLARLLSKRALERAAADRPKRPLLRQTWECLHYSNLSQSVQRSWACVRQRARVSSLRRLSCFSRVSPADRSGSPKSHVTSDPQSIAEQYTPPFLAFAHAAEHCSCMHTPYGWCILCSYMPEHCSAAGCRAQPACRSHSHCIVVLILRYYADNIASAITEVHSVILMPCAELGSVRTVRGVLGAVARHRMCVWTIWGAAGEVLLRCRFDRSCGGD